MSAIRDILIGLALGFVLVAVLSVGGCAQDPISTSPTNNANVPVSLLFEHEGCRMYRFIDDGRFRYYARCANGDTTTAEWNEHCGRNCTRVVTVPEASR